MISTADKLDRLSERKEGEGNGADDHKAGLRDKRRR